MRRGTSRHAIGRQLVLNHRNTTSRKRAEIAHGKKRDKEQLMLDVFMVALGLGFFVAAVSYAYACERL
jgi:hypothetical protein